MKLRQEKAFGTQDFAGMTKREYTAIKLRVPDSSEEWLDEMIKKSNRREAALLVMSGILSTQNGFKIDSNGSNIGYVNCLIEDSLRFADRLLKQ